MPSRGSMAMRDRGHRCRDGEWSPEPSWWVRDAQRIELCRVCHRCEREHLLRYRPEILGGYNQVDVDELID